MLPQPSMRLTIGSCWAHLLPPCRKSQAQFADDVERAGFRDEPRKVGSTLSCDFFCCLLVTFSFFCVDSVSCDSVFFLVVTFSPFPGGMPKPLLTTLTTIQEPQAYPSNFSPLPSVEYGSVSCTAIQRHYDSEGVPRGIWIASREAGRPPSIVLPSRVA